MTDSHGRDMGALDQAIAEARVLTIVGENGMPAVMCSDRDLPDVTHDALTALHDRDRDSPRIFSRGRQLVRIGTDQELDAGGVVARPFIDLMTEAAFRGELARAASYMVAKGKSLVRGSPPRDLVQDAMSLGDWSKWAFSVLAGIVEQPVIRPDGSILDIPGYDVATGLYYAPAPGLVIPRYSC